MHKYIAAFFTIIFFQSCTQDQSESSDVLDPFFAQITQQLNEMVVVDSRIIETPDIFRPGRILQWNEEYLIVEDASQRTLNLIRADGTKAASAGGQGRGPGEFELINQLHKGSDGLLYVLDRSLTRISTFRVVEDEIRYISSYLPDVPDQMLLTEIFVSGAGYFALFNHTDDYMTGENRYLLYETDEQFNTAEVLFEMKGTEKIEMDRFGFIDHPLAKQSLWSQQGNYFYMLPSHQVSWQQIDLRTG